MKIRTRITIICTLIMLLAIGVTIALAVHSIISEGRSQAENIRTLELENTKKFLKNYVDTACQTIDYEYKSTTDKDLLQKRYGAELKTAVSIVENIIARNKLQSLSHFDVLALLEEFNRINTDSELILYLYKLPLGHIHTSDVNTDVSKERLEYYLKHGQKYSERFIVLTELNVPRISYLKFNKKNNLLIGAGFMAPKVITDAKTRSRNTLRKFLYNNGEGYIFAFDTACIAMVHPHMQYRELTDFSYEKDMSGRRIIAEMVNMCLKNDHGFINYFWPKPTADRKMLPDKDKLSYVRLFKPWMWIVGSGTYIDEINIKTEEQKKAFMTHVYNLVYSTIQNTLVIFLVMAVISIVFSKTLSRPIESLARIVNGLDINKLPQNIPKLKGPHEIVRLGEIFNKMLDSLKLEMEKVRQETSARMVVEGELEVARNIQTNIAHRIFPPPADGPEFDIHSLYYPALPGSGSFLDMFRIDTNKLAVVIGDSTGKGVPASLYSIIVRTILRNQPSTNDAGELVTNLNRALASNRQDMGESLFLGIIELPTGKMSYCNAGCSFPVIIRKRRRLEDLPTTHGEPVGVNSGVTYSSDSVVLEPNDILLLYSPGLIEPGDIDAPSLSRGEVKKRIESSLKTSREETISCIVNTIENSIPDCQQKRDIIFAVFEYLGAI